MRPAKLAPQTTTSYRPLRGVLSLPRLVSRLGICRNGNDVRAELVQRRLRTAWCVCNTLRLVAVSDATTGTEPAEQQESRSRCRPPSRPTAGNGAAGSDNLLIEVDGKLVPNYDATIHPFSEGDVVSGKAVRIDQDEVLVDIAKVPEVIPSNELRSARTTSRPRRSSSARRSTPSSSPRRTRSGRLILSKKRARLEKAWRRIERAADLVSPFLGRGDRGRQGRPDPRPGRARVPARLTGRHPASPELDEFMGQTLECKVIELNRSRNNVVLSRRAVLEEERKEVREQILGRLQPGQVVEGKISNIVDFGALSILRGLTG